jgi:hypothetical protein
MVTWRIMWRDCYSLGRDLTEDVMGTLECLDVAKSKGRPKTDRDDGTAKVDRGVLGMAKMVAAIRKISVAEYLTGLLRGPVEKDFGKEMERLKGGKA